MNRNLFSIDVEAHLKKAASHTFGSLSHYPVELVRAALRREARQVDVRISRGRIQVTDNGTGLDEASIKTLTCLLDPARSTEAKEAAVESLQTRSGFGFLALFAPSPEKILVENVTDLGKKRVLFHKDQLHKVNTCSLNVGTRITLFVSRLRDTAMEKRTLRIYCQSVQRDIRLNNRIISRRPLLAGTHQMATLRIKGSPQLSHGAIGVPHTGDLCRLRLLDMGIPYRYVTLPPYKGFIFEAAVEYTGKDTNTYNVEITGSLLNHLVEYTFRLYQWLCRHHVEAPPTLQARIEELIFTHHRLTKLTRGSQEDPASASLMEHFAPFKMFRSSHTLTLPQMIRKSRTSPIFAVPRHKEQLRYNTLGKTVLSLTREQADFLVNQEQLPITFLAPVFQKQKRFPALFYALKKGSKRFIFRFFRFLLTPSREKILTLDQLTPVEQLFLLSLNNHLSRQIGSAVLVVSKGPFPAIPPKKNKEGGISSGPLLIMRDHPLVRKAVQAVQTDTASVELFAPLLM